jgi:hypothetical protein
VEEDEGLWMSQFLETVFWVERVILQKSNVPFEFPYNIIFANGCLQSQVFPSRMSTLNLNSWISYDAFRYYGPLRRVERLLGKVESLL